MIRWLLPLLTLPFLLTCDSDQLPIELLTRQLSNEKSYTISLEDMKEEGFFFKDYLHRYQIITGEKVDITNWMAVDESYFSRHTEHLGMALVTKSEDGKITTIPAPAGYQYVGNPKYGQWRTDSSGGSFWEFYGKYAMLQSALGLASSLIHRRDYDGYLDHRQRGLPYYGKNNEYGTNGSLTKKSHSAFFQRKQNLKGTRSGFLGKFQSKFNGRTGRSQSSSRGRGISFGK